MLTRGAIIRLVTHPRDAKALGLAATNLANKSPRLMLEKLHLIFHRPRILSLCVWLLPQLPIVSLPQDAGWTSAMSYGEKFTDFLGGRER